MSRRITVDAVSRASRDQAPARRPRRAGGSLFAAGEPAVWLTGGALAICTVMVAGLLLLVLWQGLATFWPQPVVRLETLDQRVYMGEITRVESHRPDSASLDDLPGEPAAAARQHLARDGEVLRRLVRTGNFRLTQRHFAWVDDFAVKNRQTPAWALVLERLEWGRFYGFPLRFVRLHPLDGAPPAAVLAQLRGTLAAERTLAFAVAAPGPAGYELRAPGAVPAAVEVVAVAEIAEGAQAAWEAYREYHDSVRARWRLRRHLEKHDAGALSRRQEQARLAVRAAELALENAGDRDDQGPAVARARVHYQAALRAFEQVRVQVEGAFAGIRAQIDRLNEENGRYRLVLETAGEGDAPPETTELRLDEIVRAYPANQLTLAAKLDIYRSRWWEFLSDEPREANSEGGVLPAIFGTAAMTLIMCLAVVPLGVLAALYLREYAPAGAVVSVVRIAVNNLAGVPSIVFGVFGLGFLCYGLGASLDELLFAANLPSPTFGKGGILWASLTLALLTLPVVIVATEEAVAAVPSSMREGSYACGASKWQTIRRIILPRAMPGIITGMVLAIARGAGEVAPLMLVGAVKLAPELPIDGLFPYLHPERSFMHLGFHIYDVGFQSQNSEAAKPMVFTTTLLLIAMIAALNLAAVWLRGRLRKKYEGALF